MGWFSRTVPARECESCSKRLDDLEDRVERAEGKLELDRVRLLAALEKVVFQVTQRLGKRERDESRQVPEEESPKDAPGPTIGRPGVLQYRRPMRGW